MARQQSMLTTFDNPYNPFEQFDEWYSYDMEKGYDCCGRLDRLTHFTDEMTDDEMNQETERAIDRLIELDFTDTFTKITKQLKDVTDEDVEDI